jgi:polysaccharide export outer membrane protein
VIRPGAAVLTLLTLVGCTGLPHAGPSGAELDESELVELINVTPEMADELSRVTSAEQATDFGNAILALKEGTEAGPFRFSPGDELTITLWSFTQPSGASLATPSSPQATELGTYVLAEDGTIELPYVGSVSLGALELAQAQRLVSQRFESLGVFRMPSVVIVVESSPRAGILVTGAIGSPKLVPWSPAGRTLAEAITEALGDESTLLREEGDMRARLAVEVDVQREGRPPVSLPMQVALRETVPLHPGDRIIVREEAKVVVAMLGAGIRNNGQLSFARSPTLTEALSRAAGLDSWLADGNAVFVMRKRESMRPLLYNFAWDRTQGLLAAQGFYLANNDVVYVAEAPLVSVQKVSNTLFQLVLPAQILK